MLRKSLFGFLSLSGLLISSPLRAESELKGKLLDQLGGVECVAVDPTGAWLVTSSGDGSVRLWDLKADDPWAKSRFVLRGHEKPIQRLAAADPAATSVLLHEFSKKARTMLISPDSRWLVTLGGDKTVRCWDLRAIKE
jgi:WD40 repeat protein